MTASVKVVEAKLKGLRNLSHTMAGLIKNIVEEVDSSRSQMFKILENVASIDLL